MTNLTELHVDALLVLHQAAELGLPVETLLADLRRARHRHLALPKLESALRDLADRSYATAFESGLGAKRWRITALGISMLIEEGLA